MKNKINVVKDFFVVKNDKGIHTRPATEIVKCSVKFKSEILLTHQEQTVSGKSLLGILILAAAKGSVVEVTAKGEDAQEAVQALIKLSEKNFNIQY